MTQRAIQKLLHSDRHLPHNVKAHFEEFYHSYLAAAFDNGYGAKEIEPLLLHYYQAVVAQVKRPYHFEAYHARQQSPVDYHELGLNLIRPLIKWDQSRLHGKEYLPLIADALRQKENVIFLANHQIEADPQAINLLLGDEYRDIAAEMIFVAGHRVVSDPMSVPLSRGVNMLCIYSKSYVDNPPEEKAAKLHHNQRTMQKMSHLLSLGGKCIYVAPGGGRDRPDSEGKVQIRSFDAASIEMFHLIAKQSKKPCHFHSLALDTYRLMPPPDAIAMELGEKRHVFASPVQMKIGPEIDMEMDGAENRQQRRSRRAEIIWQQVAQDYMSMIGPYWRFDAHDDNKSD